MGLKCPTVTDVVAAQARVGQHLRTTPNIWSAERGGFLKLENLQLTGAYKVRGALNALCSQLERGDLRPVVAASAGNHSAGMAWAAKHLGLRSTAVVPQNAPASKIASTRRLGAEVIIHGDSYEAAQQEAMRLAELNDWRFLSAFDDPDIIAGQGTALELTAAKPDVVLVPIGGGGLASGVGIVLKDLGISMVGVCVDGVDAMKRSLSGNMEAFAPRLTIADGTRVSRPGILTSAICAQVLDDIITIPESLVRKTMAELALHEGIVVEGAGALAAAALPLVNGKRKSAIVSGGNVDPAVLAQVLGTLDEGQDGFHRRTDRTLVRPTSREPARLKSGSQRVA